MSPRRTAILMYWAAPGWVCSPCCACWLNESPSYELDWPASKDLNVDGMSPRRFSTLLSVDQVNGREDHDPDHVDKVPVKPCNFHVQAFRLPDLAPPDLRPKR